MLDDRLGSAQRRMFEVRVHCASMAISGVRGDATNMDEAMDEAEYIRFNLDSEHLGWVFPNMRRLPWRWCDVANPPPQPNHPSHSVLHDAPGQV